MKNTSLINAISQVIESNLQKSPDHLIRVDIKKSFPLSLALKDLIPRFPNLIIGILKTINPDTYSECDLIVEKNASVLTRYRNDFGPSGRTVILVGPAVGPEESGLRDLAVVISDRDICDRWQEIYRRDLSAISTSHETQIRLKISDWFFDKMRKGELNPPTCSELLELLLDPSVSLVDFQKALWKVDLIPDEKLVSHPNIKARLEKNFDVVGRTQSEENEELVKRLKKSTNKKVVAYRDWLKNRSDELLSKSGLPEVLNALEEEDVETGTGTVSPPRVASHHLFSILRSAESSQDIEVKKNLVSLIRDEITNQNETYFEYGGIDISVALEDSLLKFKVDSRESSNLTEWFRELDKAKSDETISDSLQIPVFIYGTELNSDRSLVGFSVEAFRAWGTDIGLSDEVEKYLQSRSKLLNSSRLLTASEEDVLSLITISKDFRDVVGHFLDSWVELLRKGIAQMDSEKISLLQFIDAIWIRDIETEENSSSDTFSPSIKFDKVLLSPWHPWRLKPIFDLALEIEGNESEYEVVSSAFWALSRAVPLYRVWASSADKDNLQFKTIVSGDCEFGVVDTQAIQPLTGESKSIARSLSAYKETHPWSDAGTTMLIVNPPNGGAIRKLANTQVLDESTSTAVRVIRTKNLAGQDPDDQYLSLLGFHDVDNPTDFIGKDGNNEVTFVFLPAMHASINSMQLGAHGRIDLQLKATAVKSSGEKVFEPQITVSPSDENDFINLIYRASGQTKTHIAEYPLVLPDDHLRIIQKCVLNSEWTIVAIPGAVGAPEINFENDLNLNPSIVAQFDDNQYRCFTYSRSLLPLVWKIRDYINEQLPIGNTAEKQKIIVEALTDIAGTQHTKMFELSNNKFGVTEILGVLSARAFAKNMLRPDSLILEISLDDTDWTNSWLDSRDQRADLLMVDISPDIDSESPVKLLVIEAKARSDAFGSPHIDVDPFDGASNQVHMTIDKIRRLMLSPDSSISQSIRLRAFTEQIAAVAASEFLRSKDQRQFEKYFKNISRFISEPESALESIRGLVVAQFLKGLEEAQVKEIQDTTLVSCSSKTLEEIFLRKEITFSVLKDKSDEITVSVGAEVNANPVSDTVAVHSEEVTHSGSTEDKVSSTSHLLPSDNNSDSMTSNKIESVDKSELIDELLAVLKLKTDEIDTSQDSILTQGPTYNAFSIPFIAGSSIANLQRVAKDLARDLGVTSVDIKNDSLPKRVLVLVPRKDRVFPIQPEILPLPSSDSYLPIYVGQELDGTEHVSTIQSWPHALIAGTTGSGKTSFLRGVIKQIASDTRFPSKLIVVDGKGESDYFGLAPEESFHENWSKPQLSIDSTVEILEWLVKEEIPRRRRLVNEIAEKKNSRVDAREEYLSRLNLKEDLLFSPLVIVIDEFAELMLRGGTVMKDFIDNVSSVSQTGRSTLVHLLLATQRPDRKIVPGRIHANLDTKIALRVPTPADSMTVLGHGGAEKLLGRGDMLFSWKGSGDLRLQGYFYS